MQKQVLLFVLVATTFSYSVTITGADCSCGTFTTQTNCAAAGSCEWSNSACQNLDCSTKTTIATCNIGNNCAFTTSSSCSTFTQCSDYKYADGSVCLTIGCQAGTKGSDGLYSCTTIDSTLLQNCSTYTTQTSCTNVNCYWNGSTCAAPTCAQQTTSLACISIRADSISTRQICSWTASTNTCSDAAGLTEAQCSVLTLGSYYWDTNTSACLACPSSYAQIIALAALIIIGF